jgi:hypothetical protein
MRISPSSARTIPQVETQSQVLQPTEKPQPNSTQSIESPSSEDDGKLASWEAASAELVRLNNEGELPVLAMSAVTCISEEGLSKKKLYVHSSK